MERANEQLARHYEREAESTRHSLANTLHELNARLTPGHMFDEVMSYARGGGGSFTRAFSNAVRENPFPALLICTGCMLFLSERMGLSSRAFSRSTRHDLGHDEPVACGVETKRGDERRHGARAPPQLSNRALSRLLAA